MFNPNYYHEHKFLGDDHDDWFSWGLNQIPWRQAENETWGRDLPRLSAYYPREEMPDRLSGLLYRLNQQFWLESFNCSCSLLKNEEHKIGWKSGEDGAETLLLGLSHDKRKVLVKPPGTGRGIPCEVGGGDVLVLPPDTEFSVPRTKQPKNLFMLLLFGS